VSDIIRSSSDLSIIGPTLSRIPSDVPGLKQYAPVYSIFQAKSSLVKEGIHTSFESVFIITPNSIRIDTSVADPRDLWECASRMGIESVIASTLASKMTECIFSPILCLKSIKSVTSTDFELAFAAGSTDDPKSISDLLGAIFTFLPRFLSTSICRRVWIPLAPRLSKVFGYTETLANLENEVFQATGIPSDAPRYLVAGWDSLQKNMSESITNSALSDLRTRLLADMNRKTVHLNLNHAKQFQATYIPRSVSFEVLKMVQQHFKAPSSGEVISKLMALFTTMRQPEFVDPRGLNPRNAGIYFNDCVYLTLALSLLKDLNMTPDIVLLRAAASRAISFFTRAVSNRAVQHLLESSDGSWAQGLITSQQVSIAEAACHNALGEIIGCSREWKALEIDAQVCDLWTAMIVDSIIKEMNRLALVSAKSAIGSKPGLLKSTGPINSGIWSVHRKFTQDIIQLLNADALSVLNSWRVTIAIRTALCGNSADINNAHPISDPDTLGGLSKNGIESLLACNPLLQGETKEKLGKYAEMLLHSEVSDSSDKKMNDERDYGALFSRA